MLRSLRITNFVLIDECRIEFDWGLNVLTGETGAGKSMIIDALSLLLGERSASGLVRDPSSEVTLEAVFELDSAQPAAAFVRTLLEEHGLPAEDGLLIIHRRIAPEGRSRIFVNHAQCLLKCLKELGECLVDLHGQHEHQSLLNKSSYRPLLDRFGDYGDALETYQATYRQWQSLCEQLAEMEAGERERLRQLDMLNFQRDEIDQAALQPGEDRRIEESLNLLQHAERLNERCAEINLLLNDNDDTPPVLDRLDQIEAGLTEMAEKDPTLAPLLQSYQNAVITIKEAARELQSYGARLEHDPDELERMQERRYLINDLKKKYGGSIEEILAYRGAIHEQICRFENFDEALSNLRQQEEQTRQALIELGQALHKKRQTTARQIAKKVTGELKHLHMNQAKFSIQVNDREAREGITVGTKTLAFGPYGCDEVEFLISTIPGKPPRPLREVASGGEISRIMLALKCALGTADPVPTMIFDEIDVGVGGKTADAVGERLADIAQQKQILCITHLPQIASKARRNLRVEKRQANGQLQTLVSILNQKERETELARMLGGEDSAASKKFARELLNASER